MLKVHEYSDANGELRSVFLRFRDEALEVVDDQAPFPLPAGSLRAVMARYGAPFDPDAGAVSHGSLLLGDGATLRHVRHLAGYDVIARDYLVHEQPGQEPLCAMATTVAAALLHLGRAAALG